MRKQTKLVAVASAAALLAIGASMTSFAATGWVEEGGQWFYYNNDGSRAEDEWKKSGDKWFWLDSEEGGAMAIDKVVEDDDDIYYVDSTGSMVTNTWVRVVNEDQDDDDPAEYHYYYMQSNGKAYTASSSSSSRGTRFRTIDGKRYAFDEDGIMLYGWVNDDAEMMTDESDWATVDENIYYLGDWSDGAMKTGWQQITVYDEDDDDDVNHWFYFLSNGKRFYNNNDEDSYRTRNINGNRYGFDARGVMVYQWTLASDTSATGYQTPANWSYFRDPEDGARVTRGWFKVIPPNEDNTFGSLDNSISFDADGADDEDEYWYYANGDGELYAGTIERIRGRYYGFAPETSDHPGRMLSGLVLMQVNEDGETIENVADFGIDGDELDDLISGDDYAEELAAGYALYYFGSDADSDGSLKTGNTTVTVDGDTYNFLFGTSGDTRGRGLTGLNDNKYIYKAGVRIKADSEDRYQVVRIAGENGVNTTDDDVTVTKISASSLRGGSVAGAAVGNTYQNRDNERVRFVTLDNEDNDAFYLVNSSGSVTRNRNAAKDGDDWYFYVEDRNVKLYTNNNTLRTEDGTVEDWEDLLPSGSTEE